MREFAHSLTIDAPPAAVLDAFFDPEALAAWWQASAARSACRGRSAATRSNGTPTEWRDEVLGRLGGAFHGTVIEFKPGREFFVADAYWLPPDGEPIGPMALEATCTPHGDGTVLHVRQSGWDESRRWTRYYEIMSTGFMVALEELKKHLEARAT